MTAPFLHRAKMKFRGDRDVSSVIDRIKKKSFHFKHEAYTRLAYSLGCLPPHRFVFVLTNQCNLNCPKCYQDREKKTLLSKERWIRLSDEIPAFSRITLTGGEPLMFPGFRDVFKSVAKRHPCNLITNGTLLTEELIDLFLSFPKFKVLAISMDGLKLDPENARVLDERQWNALESSIAYFVRRKKELKSECCLEIKTLVLDENAGKLLDIHRYCAENLKTDYHTFQFLKGTPLQHSDRLFDYEDIFRSYEAPVYGRFDEILIGLSRVRDYNVAFKKTAFMHPISADLNREGKIRDLSFLNRSSFDASLFQPCRFPWSSLHVNYDGELFPCLSVPIGSIKDRSLRQVLTGKPYRRFLSDIRKKGLVGACNRCGWLRLNK